MSCIVGQDADGTQVWGRERLVKALGSELIRTGPSIRLALCGPCPVRLVGQRWGLWTLTLSPEQFSRGGVSASHIRVDVPSNRG